jgi:hypothetical protein
VELLGCQQRKAFGKVEPHLRAEDRMGADAGTVVLPRPFVDYPLHEIEILPHRTGPYAGERRFGQAGVFHPMWRIRGVMIADFPAPLVGYGGNSRSLDA